MTNPSPDTDTARTNIRAELQRAGISDEFMEAAIDCELAHRAKVAAEQRAWLADRFAELPVSE